MNFRQFRRGFLKTQSNFTWWLNGNLFCYGHGYQVQINSLGQDQYMLVENPIRWEFDDNMQKMVLSWYDNTGNKVVSTSGELYEENVAYDEYVSQFYA